MLLNITWQRIWRNRGRNLLTLTILLLPSLDLLSCLYDIIFMSVVVPIPDYAFFLMTQASHFSFLSQFLFLWVMPLYALVLTCDDCLEDYKTQYSHVMMSRIGKKRYIHTHMAKSFLYMFFLTASALLLNLLLCHLLFSEGAFNSFGEDFRPDAFYQWEKAHPLLTNLLFTVIVSFFSGFIAVVGVMSAVLFQNRKLVYGITMMFWFVPTLQEKSLMLLFQPHSEYVLNTLIPIGVRTGLMYGIYILLIYAKEVLLEKKLA